jgi:hypothetical protein
MGSADMAESLPLVGCPHSRNSRPAMHFVAGAIDHGNLVIANVRLYASTDVFGDAHSFVSRVRLSWRLGDIGPCGCPNYDTDTVTVPQDFFELSDIHHRPSQIGGLTYRLWQVCQI